MAKHPNLAQRSNKPNERRKARYFKLKKTADRILKSIMDFVETFINGIAR
jgi:hypothetical protein